MSRTVRIALVSSVLMLAGCLAGALAMGGGGALGLLLRPEGTGIAAALLPFEALVGAALGALFLPLGAWLLLRRTPLWQVCLVPALGGVVGQVLEWTRWNQTMFGAGLGLAVGVMLLAVLQRRSATHAVVGPTLGDPRHAPSGRSLPAGAPRSARDAEREHARSSRPAG
jgi:hypothetical protein